MKPTRAFQETTPEGAVEKHEAGSIHCLPLAEFGELHLSPKTEPWLRGHLYQMGTPEVPELVLICFDTEGLTPEQTNVLLARLYGRGDIVVQETQADELDDQNSSQ